MRKISWILLFLFSVLFLSVGCKKDTASSLGNDPTLIDSARVFFEQTLVQKKTAANSVEQSSNNPRIKNAKKALWEKATIKNISLGKAVVVPVSYDDSFFVWGTISGNNIYNINQLVKLLVYQDQQNNYHAELLTFFPDSTFSSRKAFSGIVFVDDWSGNAIKKYKIDPDGRILKNNIAVNVPTTSVAYEAQTRSDLLEVIQTCYEQEFYNYSVDDPDDGYYYYEPAGCSYEIIGGDDGGDGATGGDYAGVSGAGGGVGPSTNLVTLSPGDNIIGNIKDYTKCFTNLAGNINTYTITVCVDQPDPGTRETWGFEYTSTDGSSPGGNPFNVGHTFLIFSQTSAGNTITRNVGFYPATSVSPRSPSAAGQLNDDELHAYNISLSVTVTNSQFFNALNYVQQNSSQYNLNTDNCTTFAIRSLYAANIYLPSTIGTWPGGSGNDPGDLGEDIRSMSLSSDMTRNTVSNSHPNLGNCY